MKKSGLIVLIVLLLASVSVYVIGRQLHWWGGSCDVPQSISEKRAMAGIPLPGERAGVYTVDSGFESRSADGKTRGGAVAIKNASKSIAYRTKVKFKVRGYRDNSENDRLISRNFYAVVPVIVPGQRVEVGRNFPGFRYVHYISVGPTTTTWLPRDPDEGPSRDDLGDGFSPPKSSYRGTVHRGSGKLDEIRYTERSKSCRTLRSRGTAVVFRNKKGQIVGGDLLKPRGGKARPCSPGRHEFRLPVPNKVPPRADDSRTEVYSYCDLNVPKHDVNKRPS